MKTINKRYRIVYCVPSLYIPGGVERVLTLKANYFAENYGYEIIIVLTDGKDKPNAYPLSPAIKVINLDINFEELWNCSFVKKVVLYLKKQYLYKKRLTKLLLDLRPDITDSLLRREINFLTKVPDGSKKIGELHVSKNNFRTYKDVEANFVKNVFSRYWISMVIPSLRRLDKFVVLTEQDKSAWIELNNVIAIPNPVSFDVIETSPLKRKRVLSVGRYDYVKGFDMLLKAWAIVEKENSDWELAIYGAGNREPYERIIDELGIDRSRCVLNGNTAAIQKEYLDSSLFVISSRFEGLSMAMLEALSFGLPVVSFECPCGPRDVITDGKNGKLVPREDVSKLAEAMISLINRPDEIVRMGELAHKRADDFKIEVIADRWKQLFEELIG